MPIDHRQSAYTTLYPLFTSDGVIVDRRSKADNNSVRSVVLSPDGKIVVSGSSDNSIAPGDRDGRLSPIN